MYFVAQLVGKAIAFLSPFLNRGGGTSAPGMALLKIYPNGFYKLSKELSNGCILISATNGKTTTTRFLSEILNNSGIDCISNSSGANLKSGLTTALLKRKSHQSTGVLETDEGALPEITKESSPRMLVLMNLFRDQLDRYGELESITKSWRKMVMELPESTKLIVNADDPALADIGLLRSNTIFFGIGDATDYAHREPQHAADSIYCPRCNARLTYDQVTLSHMGSWECTECDLTRPELDFKASDIELDGIRQTKFTISHEHSNHSMTSNLPGLHNVYNALAAFVAANEFGVQPEEITSTIRSTTAAFGRTEQIMIHGRELNILLAKNPAGANANIETLLLYPNKIHLCVLLNDQVADGRDVSWIWDVDYEKIFQKIETLHIGGERGYDLALRFLYGGFESEKIKVVGGASEVLDDLIAATPEENSIFVLPSYTAMLDFRNELVERNLTHAFWEDGQ